MARTARLCVGPAGAADLPKREMALLGACLDSARREVGWTVDQLARELHKDAKQIGRWIRGEERTQVDTVFAVVVLQQPLLVALARWAGMTVDITIRRTA